MKLQLLHLVCSELGLDLRVCFDRAGVSITDGSHDAETSPAPEAARNIRPVTLVYGAPGVGKSTLLNAIGHTRPGHTVNLIQQLCEIPLSIRCEWLAGIDIPDRAKPIELSAPQREENPFAGPSGLGSMASGLNLASATAEKRREAALVDRLARDGGFVFGAFSALRWFSQTPLLLSAPERTLTRHDTRALDPLGDAARQDLTRSTLAFLAFAECSAAVSEAAASDIELCEVDHQLLKGALRTSLSNALLPLGAQYLGLNPATLEACVRHAGRVLAFRQLPAQIQNVIALIVGTVRLLWAGYPGLNPLLAQGVFVIDEVERYLDAAQADTLLTTLARTFPETQWIATTRSAELLALRDTSECVVLRRGSEAALVQAFTGDGARIH